VCSPPCTSSCSAWQTQCSGTQIQTCTLQSNGCYAWSTATNCPGSQTCQGTTCQNPSCTSLSTEYFCAQYRPTWSDAITSGACPGTQGCYRCQADHPTYCATRGVCANMQSDDNNCGGCGIVCSGGQTCQNGVCSCASGTLGDSNNCGWCGNDCGTWVCDPVARTCAECLDSENDASNHYRNPQCMYANDGQACMSNQCSCVDDGHCQDGWTCNTATHRCELI
jgi:hypothetical protein